MNHDFWEQEAYQLLSKEISATDCPFMIKALKKAYLTVNPDARSESVELATFLYL
ncbi:hypothetical protein [Effusibacillus lacus]|uniref:hypothetical protein n=1 Tax=Effusibacillus lacus TaxID=1348429 RepID=UPI0010F1E6E1|nr:hypothetical protein [Effusibacillus lacus]TCS67957.1 hypothetical protein EDD64_1474 [Effusibacillus lacus]